MEKSSARKTRVFLSGPMTGYEDYNFGKFDAVAESLRGAGVDVVNPADICRRYRRERVLADEAVFRKMIDEQQAAERTCTAVLLLDGWEASAGVRKELATALELGLDLFLEKDAGLLRSMARTPGARLGHAARRISDEDWKTQSARGYPDVPAGARVLVLEEGMYNFYGGPWTRVEWNGNMYWTKPDSVSVLGKENS